MSTPSDRPKGWGEDSLSAFLESANGNTLFFFAKYPAEWRRLADIDEVLTTLLANSPKGFAAFMFFQAHSAFRAAVRLLTSGQTAEGYMVLRGCLEMALYGAFMHDHEDRVTLWLQRQDGKDEKQAVRDLFKIGLMLHELEDRDGAVGARTRDLYNRTIDLGAHPNEMALSSRVRKEEKPGTFQLSYTAHDRSVALALGIKTACQVGVSCLDIYELLYPEHARLVGVSSRLPSLRAGL